MRCFYTRKQVLKSIIFQDIFSKLSRRLQVYNAVDTAYPLDRLVRPIETLYSSHQKIYTFRFRCAAKRDMRGLSKLLTNGNSPSLLAS